MLAEDFAGRVFWPLTSPLQGLMPIGSARKQWGQPLAMADAQIADTCLAHGARLARCNKRHFDGLDLVCLDPWQGDAA